jgi:DNA-directed RNA polymerase specialized sigma24 family protein
MPQALSVAKDSTEDCGELAGLVVAVAGLPNECKRVLTLRKIYGWGHDRIAAHLGIERHEVESDLRDCVLSIARYYGHSQSHS